MKKMFLKFLYLKTCSTSKLFSPIQKNPRKGKEKNYNISGHFLLYTKTEKKNNDKKKYHFSQKNMLLQTTYYTQTIIQDLLILKKQKTHYYYMKFYHSLTLNFWVSTLKCKTHWKFWRKMRLINCKSNPPKKQKQNKNLFDMYQSIS